MFHNISNTLNTSLYETSNTPQYSLVNTALYPNVTQKLENFESDMNSSTKTPMDPVVLITKPGQIVISLFYFLLAAVALGANSLIVLLIVCTRRLRTNTNMFLASQVRLS